MLLISVVSCVVGLVVLIVLNMSWNSVCNCVNSELMFIVSVMYMLMKNVDDIVFVFFGMLFFLCVLCRCFVVGFWFFLVIVVFVCLVVVVCGE